MSLGASIAISVIIPTYNREKTIKYCLDSVLNQTYSPLEVIIVDDCSTDATLEIVKSYKSSAIIIIPLEKKSGAQRARNVGIKNAKGKWIAFLDSDDEWKLDKLERQVKELERSNFNEYLVIHGNCKAYKPHLNRYEDFNINIISGSNVMPALLYHPAPFFQAMFTSKKALEEIGYLDENVPAYQEWDTALQLSKICSFQHMKETLFYYYLHDDETISKDKTRDILGYNYVRQKYKAETLGMLGSNFYYLDSLWNITRAIQYDLPNVALSILKETYPDRNYLSRVFNFVYKLNVNPVFFLKTMSKLKSLAVKQKL